MKTEQKPIITSELFLAMVFTITTFISTTPLYAGDLERFEELSYLCDPTPKKPFCVIGAWGVLDRETGLVWEKSPSTLQHTWTEAQAVCYQKTVGNRKGWRTPAVEELASLVDTLKTNPALPAGHPFPNVSVYWSATTVVGNESHAWTVNFGSGTVSTAAKFPSGLTFVTYVWCVRGYGEN